MKSNEEIFEAEAKKLNKDFNFHQFATRNQQLYAIIINSMRASIREVTKDRNRWKKIVEDDTDYKAMRAYAKELEAKLGIDQEKGK